ncbi:MAG: hypothetical protein ACE5I9_11065 [Candidatus Methylomirabilales bacterium]
MDRRLLILACVGLVLASGTGAGRAEACGGVTAFIAEDARALGVRPATGPGGITFYYGKDGNALLPALAVKVESALAEAIAKRYLEKKYGNYGHLEFEALSYDHGDFVYMYHADVPNLPYSVHVGPVAYVTTHAHVHVSAVTGDVYGPGCGLGSGIVEMPFDPTAYPQELFGKRIPSVQFDSHFIAGEGAVPKIDGRIDSEEWQGAGHTVITVGTPRKKVTSFG